MLIKFDDCGNYNLIYIPEKTAWRIVLKVIDDDSEYDTYCLYLQYGDQNIRMRNASLWCDGRSKLPDYAVGDLYESIIDAITELLVATPDISYICIDDIEYRLLTEKFEKIWIERGYITPDENGRW